MRRLFFYFDGGRWPTFWFFKSLDNNMVYSLGIYICAKGIFTKISIHIFLTFGEVGGSPTSCAQKLLQKPIRSRELCAHKPIKPREQCAHKPIKPLRGPAPGAGLPFCGEDVFKSVPAIVPIKTN